MEPILLAIRLLGSGYHSCPHGHERENGYYAMSSAGPVWVPLDDQLGQRAYDPEELRGEADRGNLVPIFHLHNIGTTRTWPRILYYELARYTIEIFQIAADIYDTILRPPNQRPSGNRPGSKLVEGGADIYNTILQPPNQRPSSIRPGSKLVEGAGLPTPSAIATAARLILTQERAKDYPESVRHLLQELGASDVFDHTALPWCSRTIYRRPGRRTCVSGASIDLSGPKDLDGKREIVDRGEEIFNRAKKNLDKGQEIVDFQDIFVALAPFVDFLRSPAPPLIVNRCGKLHLHREDPNLMTGVYGPLCIEVREKMELTLLTKDDDTDILPYIQKIEEALIKHQIISGPGAVTYTYETTLYIESVIPITFQVIYAALILNPRTHFRRFYINEVEKIMFRRKNDVLYYSVSTPEGGDLLTHVYISPLVPKPREVELWSPFVYGSNPPPAHLKMYSIRIVHTHETHLSQFENDLVQMLYSISKRQRDIETIANLIQPHKTTKSSPVVVPPDMATFTRMYTSKTGPAHRPVSDANRPIYVPTSINGDRQLSIDIARLFSASFHSRPNEIYISVGGKLVKLDEVPRLEARGLSPDPYTALYVSASQGCPAVVNKYDDGYSMVPWVPKTAGQANSVIQATLRGLPPDRIWATAPLYKRGTDRTFFGALSTIFPNNVRDTNLQRIAIEAPGGPGAVAALCSPELFDHTTEEIIDSFAAPDSRLHYRFAEFLTNCTILVAVLVKDPYGPATEISAVELELPRHAGAQIRDFSTRPETVLLLKYRDTSPSGVAGEPEGWCYAVVFQSKPLELPAGGSRIQTSVARDPKPIIDPEARDEILAKHYTPKMAMFSFIERQHAPPIIELGHQTILNGPGVSLIRQSTNPDGYSTSITLRGPPEVIAAGLLALSRSGRPIAPTTITAPIEVTIGLISPIIPCFAPIDQTHTPAPDSLLSLISAGSNIQVRSGLPGALPSSSGTEASYEVYVIAGQFFITPAVPAALSGALEVMELQRPMTVVLSLLSYCLLQIPGIGPSDIDIAMNEIAKYAAQRGTPQPMITVQHRFPPDLSNQKILAEAALYCLQKYMPGTCIPFDAETLVAIGNYLRAERDWIETNKPPRTAIRYIAGIHDIIPEENVYPSAKSRAAFLPAKYGRASIIRTWKQYEYAATRFAARQFLESWTPFIDLTGAANAVDLLDRTAFVLRMPDGAVVYAFATTKDTGRAVLVNTARLMGLGNDYQPIIIDGYEKLKGLQMTTDRLALFGTSTALEQGSLYRIHIFAPR
jgi:hypothetical protein